MPFPVDTSAITHGIQLAIAPVFLLTAVSGMIGAVAGRLARIIDRARVLDERLDTWTEPHRLARGHAELAALRRRGHLANGCIALLTSCAVLIGLTMIVLFLGETTEVQIQRYAVAGFLAGVACFVLALLCFLAETVIATRVLDFPRLRASVSPDGS